MICLGTGCAGQTLRWVNVEEEQKQVEAWEGQLRSLQSGLNKVASEVERKKSENTTQREEVRLQLELIQKRVEKANYQYTELMAQSEEAVGFANRLMEVKARLTEQEKRIEATQSLLRKLAGEKGDVTATLTELSAQTGALSERLAVLEKQGQTANLGGAAQIKKNITELSKTLKQLGTKMTAKVDEQDRLLRALHQRIEGLESKPASVGQ